jgi:hypothetical protein
VCAAVALAAALAPSAARGQSAEVLTILRDGVNLRQQGRDAEAHARFVEAWQREPLPVCAGQRGFAAQALGRWTEADRYVRVALDAPGDDWVQRHREALERARAAIAGHIGLVEIVGGVAGTEVRLDGELAGALPLAEPLRVRAGTLLMELRAAGRHPSSRRLTVEPGVVTREPGELAPTEAPPAEVAPAPTPPAALAPLVPRAAPPAPSPFAARWVVWTLAGGAVAGLALGGLGLGLREDAARSFNDRCDPTDPLVGECAGLQQRGDVGVGLAVAGAALGVGLGVTAAVLSRLRAGAPARGMGFGCAPGPRALLCAVAF